MTKVANYRRTICAVEAEEYLLRRINGIDDPLVAKGMKAREAMLSAIAKAVSSLHQKDFETLVDVIFARSGWHRASALGGSQKLVDMVLEQPTTGERAAVQVKSAATQNILDRYIDLVDEAGTFSRFFSSAIVQRGRLRRPPTGVMFMSGRGAAWQQLHFDLDLRIGSSRRRESDALKGCFGRDEPPTPTRTTPRALLMRLYARGDDCRRSILIVSLSRLAVNGEGTLRSASRRSGFCSSSTSERPTRRSATIVEVCASCC